MSYNANLMQLKIKLKKNKKLIEKSWKLKIIIIKDKNIIKQLRQWQTEMLLDY